MQPIEISLDLSLYIFTYLSVLVLIAVCRIFSFSIRALSCCVQDLVPRPVIEPWPPALAAHSLSCWTTRDVPGFISFSHLYSA